MESQVKPKVMLAKLKQLVEKEKTFEEESMLYHYKGRDKEAIWACMEFFYKNIWNKKYPFWSDMNDKWENYNIIIRYKDKISMVAIVYGIGSTCVIGPAKDKYPKDKPILDIEKLKVVDNNVVYEES